MPRLLERWKLTPMLGQRFQSVRAMVSLCQATISEIIPELGTGSCSQAHITSPATFMLLFAQHSNRLSRCTTDAGRCPAFSVLWWAARLTGNRKLAALFPLNF